ncbi:MAG: YdcF family protein [Ignavibacteria bacterium]
MIILVEIISFCYLYYLRYENQNLLLEGFENKTGNIISVVFFSLLFLFTLPVLFIPRKLKSGAVLFLLLTSVAALACLIISDLYLIKDTRIIFITAFIIMYVYLFAAFASVLITGYREFRFMLSILIFILVFVTGVAAVFLQVLNFKDDHLKYESGKFTANSGVILGAAVWGGNRPSPVLRERINKGYEIYKNNYVQKLVITGGGSPNELTEGEVSKNVLIKYGVDPKNLFLESSSNSTVEQIHFVRDSLYNKKNWDKIILVSDNYHLLRSSQICNFNNINADCMASDKELSAGATFSLCLKESLALIIFWVSGV